MKKLLAASLLVASSLALAGCGAEKETYPAVEIKPEAPAAAPVTTPKEEEKPAPVAPVVITKPKVETVAPRKATTYVINMRAKGYSQSALTAHIGDTVTFVNEEASQHWPASLNSTKLDAGRALKMGESYSFKLITNGTLTVQDKVGKGSLIITTLK